MSESDLSKGARPFEVPDQTGQRIRVCCPICGCMEFMDSGPSDVRNRAGFRHVVVGMTGKDSIMASPVRFKHCANCGFIVQFLIPKAPET